MGRQEEREGGGKEKLSKGKRGILQKQLRVAEKNDILKIITSIFFIHHTYLIFKTQFIFKLQILFNDNNFKI